MNRILSQSAATRGCSRRGVELILALAMPMVGAVARACLMSGILSAAVAFANEEEARAVPGSHAAEPAKPTDSETTETEPPATSAAAPTTVSGTPALADLLPPSKHLVPVAIPEETKPDYQRELEMARRLRADGKGQLARVMLVDLIESDVPKEVEGEALLELGLLAEEQAEWQRALEIYNQYRERFPDSLAAPKILMRQGVLYRQMGASGSAISKFYAVMSTAIALKGEDFAAYERLVLQAQTEIADTHFLLGKYAEAGDFYRRLLRQGSPHLSTPPVRFNLIRSLAAQGLHEEAVAEASTYLSLHPGTKDDPEVRFLLSSSLKALGRNQDALQQVMLLLSSQRELSGTNSAVWIDWQRRAGNQIANQLYMEGDFVNALEIYLGLSRLDQSLAWQVPIWYQAGLIYERLGQPQKAHEAYDMILAREKELSATGSVGTKAVIDMAKWRRNFLGWHSQAALRNHELEPGAPRNLLK